MTIEIKTKKKFILSKFSINCGLHICRVGVRYREPFINSSLEVAKRFCGADILRKIVPRRSSAITEATLQGVSSWFQQVQDQRTEFSE